MSDTAKIRAELELIGQAGVDELKAKLGELNAVGGDLATALGKGEISAAEFDAGMKIAAASAKNLEQAVRALEAAQQEEDRESRDSVAAQQQLKASSADIAAAVAKLNAELRDEAAAKARDRLQAIAVEGDHLANAFAAGKISAQQFTSEMQRLANESSKVAAAEKTAAMSAKGVAAAQQAVAHGASAARQRMQGLAYSLNDFFAVQGDMSQRLNALANNMPALFAGMSSKMLGFGLALSAILPIIGMIMHNWDALSGKVDAFFGGLVGHDVWAQFKIAAAGALDFAQDRVTALDKRIKELEDNPHKVSLDIRELEAAKKEVSEIKEALSLIEQMRKSQGGYEKESGESIMATFAEEKGGQKGVEEDLVKQKRDDMLKGETGPLAPVLAEIQRVKDEIIKNEAIMKDGAASWFQKNAAQAALRTGREKTLPRLEGQRDTIAEQVTGENGLAAQDVGKLLNRATKGQGFDQGVAQRELRERLKRAGRGHLASGVAAASPEQQRINDEQDVAFDSALDAMKLTGTQNKEKRKKKAKDLLDRQKDALRDISKSDVQDPFDDATAKWANAGSKDLEESFEKAKKNIAKSLTSRLKSKGISTEGGEDEIDKTAATLADQAFGRVGKLETRQAKAAATAKAKSEKAATAADVRAAGKAATEDTKGEVKLINAGVGDQYQEDYERRLANNALFAAQGAPVAHSKAQEAKLQRQGAAYSLPEDEAKKRLMAEMGARLRRRGASPVAAQEATKQITDKGDIGLQKQLGEAQGTNQQKLMQVAGQHNATLAALINRQQMQGQSIQELLSVASQHRKHVSNAPTASNSGRP